MMDNGKMVDVVCNQPGEIKTAFGAPEDIRYGMRDQEFMCFPICNKEEDINLIL